MGILISEIVPLGRLNQEQTKDAAASLVGFSNLLRMHTGSDALTRSDIESVLTEFYAIKEGDLILHLEAAGWIKQRKYDDDQYRTTDFVIDIGNASSLPRITFEEACEKIRQLLTRLDEAPQEIDGIRLNNVFLFGSTIRDPKSRATITDIDIACDFTYDQNRYRGVPEADRYAAADRMWGHIVHNGDERLGFSHAKYLADSIVFRALQEEEGRPFAEYLGKNFVVLRIWSRPGSTCIPASSWPAIEVFEQRTLATQHRACEVAAIIAENNLRRSPAQQTLPLVAARM